MSTLKNMLLRGWNFQRWVRLLMGLGLLALYFAQKDALVLLAGSLVTVQALTNTGCCGTVSCAAPRSSSEKKQEIVYEEIK